MITYEFICEACGEVLKHHSTMSEYIRNPPSFVHCGKRMERFFSAAPSVALSNALAGDRHYDGMRAQDGADISSRAKHRAYMKAKNLTTVDDFTQTWKKAAEQRAGTLAGDDRSRATDIAHAIAKLDR